MFSKYVRTSAKTRNFKHANDARYDRELEAVRSMAIQFEPNFDESDSNVKAICDLTLYPDGTEMICDRTWRDWKKRLGIFVPATGRHDAGSYFLLCLTAKFKKKFGVKAVLTKRELIDFAKREKLMDRTRAAPEVINDPNYPFPGRLFPAIAGHLIGKSLCESYLYALFRDKLNIKFGRSNVYTIAQAEEYLTRLGYPLINKRKQVDQTQQMLDAIFNLS